MRLLRVAVVAVVTVALLAVLGFTVFPTRAYLDQREDTRRAEERLAVLSERTEVLEQRAADLDRDEEIERIAREEYGMVEPGEEAYVVLPPPLPPIDLPELWLLGDLDGAADAGASPGAGTEEPGGEGAELNNLPIGPED